MRPSLSFGLDNTTIISFTVTPPTLSAPRDYISTRGRSHLDKLCNRFPCPENLEFKHLKMTFSQELEQEDLITGQSKENATFLLEYRISTYKIHLRDESTTPLLEIEMKHALRVHSEVLSMDSDFSADMDLTRKLDALHNDIQMHWSNVFVSFDERATLQAGMGAYGAFVKTALLDDYSSLSNTNVPGMDSFLSEKNAWIHRQGTAAAEVDPENQRKGYHLYVALPLTEMGMDIPHVSKRLCFSAAACQAGAKDSGHFVSRLIQDCDWKSLAETLINDRHLAEVLFRHGSQWLRNWGPEMLATILKKNEELRQKYFEHLVSPENYTISKHAADLLARHSSSGPDHLAATKPFLPEEPHSPSFRSAIKDRLRMLADALKLNSRRNSDEQGALRHSLDMDRKSIATSSVWSDEKATLAEPSAES